ncbi:hypothetical protein GQ53DRAFT_840426 [Thozetella sp. PMI_491]|nr:hypothetical protein GQ53DRAFT_840426 [Thozetella sp. PMI_491]
MHLFRPKYNLYIGLYRRKQPGSYHWSLLLVSKESDSQAATTAGGPIGRCYRVKNILVPTENGVKEAWVYEAIDITEVRHRPDMLARVLVAKVKDKAHLERILENVPVVQNDPSFRCRVWLERALEAIHADGKLLSESALVQSAQVQEACLDYVNGKVASGRYASRCDMSRLPTWSILDNKEVIS